jgi:hypothetical protein
VKIGGCENRLMVDALSTFVSGRFNTDRAAQLNCLMAVLLMVMGIIELNGRLNGGGLNASKLMVTVMIAQALPLPFTTINDT